MYRFLSLLAAAFYLSLPLGAAASPKFCPCRGWDTLVGKLLAAGIPANELARTYKSKRMPIFDLVTFKLKPRESKNIYRGFLSAKKISEARGFLRAYRTTLSAAEQRFNVAKEVITAILLIETGFGKNTGRHMILNRLSRLANISDPHNVQENFKLLRDEDSSVTYEQVAARAEYLEDTFLPEIVALFKIARTRRYNIFNIIGSSAGAFGLPQFLPSSFLRFAVDGNNNRRISLFETADAIHSVGNYLKNFGWKEGASLEVKRKAVWAYNKSEPYIDTVLAVASRLQ